MLAVLDELQLTALVSSIPGVSAVGAADHGAGASSHGRRDHEPGTDHEQPRPSAIKPG